MSSTVATALRQGDQRLREAGVEASYLQASWLLAHALDTTRAGLLARLHELVDAAADETYRDLVARRAAREPLQYLLGRADFLDFDVAVRPGVFIPRPETECVVDEALSRWPSEVAVGRPWALDICTGSGVIAIALARARTESRVAAVDLSPTALAMARENVRERDLAGRVRCVRSDLLTGFRPHRSRCEPAVGVLVCNPPYVATGTVTQPEVRDHEPTLAWDAGPAGTEVYERLIPQASAVLGPGAAIILELGDGQRGAVTELLEADGHWNDLRLRPDLHDRPRALSAVRR